MGLTGINRYVISAAGNPYQNMATQQNPTQLERILTTPHPHHPHPQYSQQAYMPGTPGDPHHPHHHPQYSQQQSYMNQMAGSHPSLGPPPQYPANRVQPTPAGYTQIQGARPGMEMGMQIAQGGGGAGGNSAYNMYNSGKMSYPQNI